MFGIGHKLFFFFGKNINHFLLMLLVPLKEKELSCVSSCILRLLALFVYPVF